MRPCGVQNAELRCQKTIGFVLWMRRSCWLSYRCPVAIHSGVEMGRCCTLRGMHAERVPVGHRERERERESENIGKRERERVKERESERERGRKRAKNRYYKYTHTNRERVRPSDLERYNRGSERERARSER